MMAYCAARRGGGLIGIGLIGIDLIGIDLIGIDLIGIDLGVFDAGAVTIACSSYSPCLYSRRIQRGTVIMRAAS
jgi:hypothetical protein